MRRNGPMRTGVPRRRGSSRARRAEDVQPERGARDECGRPGHDDRRQDRPVAMPRIAQRVRQPASGSKLDEVDQVVGGEQAGRSDQPEGNAPPSAQRGRGAHREQDTREGRAEQSAMSVIRGRATPVLREGHQLDGGDHQDEGEDAPQLQDREARSAEPRAHQAAGDDRANPQRQRIRAG